MKTVLSLVVICVVNSALSSEQQSQVHEKLTDAEVKSIHRRERRDVPSYKFVDIKSKSGHRSKRELRSVEFEVDGEKVELNLQPVDHLVMPYYIPIWRVKSVAGRPYNYKALEKDEKKIDGSFYEDPKNMAILLAYYKGRNVYYDGVFGDIDERKVVKAAPEKWRPSESNVNEGKHFVFNVSSHGKFVPLEQHEIDSIPYKLDEPLNTFYPKLLVVVDSTLFETLGKDVQGTVKYMATYWNTVQLKYRPIEKPQIKIMVTGLIISEDPTAMEYIYRARNQTDLSNVQPQKVLDYAMEYFFTKFYSATNFDDYDAIITMANLKGSPLGTAQIGSICHELGNVGYVSDDGNFGSVDTSIHELGHLFGLKHDGEENECEGYPENQVSSVMAYKKVSAREYFWSQCSQKFLQKLAWSPNSWCMENDHRHRQCEYALC